MQSWKLSSRFSLSASRAFDRALKETKFMFQRSLFKNSIAAWEKKNKKSQESTQLGHKSRLPIGDEHFVKMKDLQQKAAALDTPSEHGLTNLRS